jgi:alkylation response protein AidB-like acyl-CoA dehydrogenase
VFADRFAEGLALLRDAPLMCIGEGTNEMQRIIIARQLVERNPV